MKRRQGQPTGSDRFLGVQRSTWARPPLPPPPPNPTTHRPAFFFFFFSPLPPPSPLCTTQDTPLPLLWVGEVRLD